MFSALLSLFLNTVECVYSLLHVTIAVSQRADNISAMQTPSRLQNSRFRMFSEGGKRRKRDPRV